MKLHNPSKILLLTAMMLICATTTTLHCQTKLYKQYKHRTDMMVACIMNYPITDSVKVDVTILAPQTKEAVYTLVEEFNLGIEKDIIDKTLWDKNNDDLLRYIVHKDNVKKIYGAIESPDDYKNISRVVYNYRTGTLLIFHDIDTEERFTAISELLMDVVTNPEKLPTIDNVKNK